jgi:hypothetical protein
MSEAIPPVPLQNLMACRGTALLLPLPVTLCYRIAKKSQYPYLAKHGDLYVQFCAVHSAQQHSGGTTDTDSVATHHFKVSKCTKEQGTYEVLYIW